MDAIPCSATDAWQHQREAFWYAYERDAVGLFMDMGTGKSKVAVDLIVNRDHRLTLILCPKSVVGVWPREIAMHAGKPVEVCVPSGPSARKAQQVATALERTMEGERVECRESIVITERVNLGERASDAERVTRDERTEDEERVDVIASTEDKERVEVTASTGTGGRVASGESTVASERVGLHESTERRERLVVVVNYEAAWRTELANVLLRVPWDCVIADESHRIKKPGGKAALFVSRVGRKAKTRIALTGTPMPHSPLDVYAQYRFLDPAIFGTSFARFRARYAVMGGFNGHEVIGYQRQEELASRMYRCAYRVMADDVLDLPDAQHIVRTCALEPAARKIYRDLETQLYADVAGGIVTAANALVRLLRLQQVTSGWLAVDRPAALAEDGQWADPDLMGPASNPNAAVGDSGPLVGPGGQGLTQVSRAKADLLADLLADVPPGEPVVVFCRFTADLDVVRRIANEQGRAYGEISGREKSGLGADARMAAGVELCGVQIASGGVGIDLTQARICVFYSTGFSLGDYEQSLKRVHRPGQHRPVVYYHLHAEGTIDTRVYYALRNRRDAVEFVLNMRATEAAATTA